MEAFDNVVEKYTTWLDNPYVAGAITVFLIVYAGAAAPKLPSYIVKMFDYTLVKLLMFFMIVFISRKNATVALVAAIALMVSIMTLNRLKFDQEMMSVVGKEEMASRQINLGNCSCNCDGFEEIMPKTSEGKLVVSEAQNAVAKGALSPAKAEELAKSVVVAEAEGKPVLIAKTEEGAKRMEEIAKGVDTGKINEETAKKMEAVIVVAESVMESKQVVNPVASEAKNVGSSNMEELKQEVLRRSQEETARRGGVAPSNEELKQLCANVLDDYRQSASCGKDSASTVSSSSDVSGVDEMASSYASVSGKQ